MAVILDATTKSLIMIMSGAPATTQPDFEVSYSAKTSTSLTGINAHGTLNGVNEVTLLGAPSSAAQNILVEASIYNADTASVTVTIKEADGATRRTKIKVTLPVGYTLHYERDSGWYVTDTNGNRMAAGVTLLPAANGGTGVANGASATLTLANAAFSLLGGGASSSLTLPNAATIITGGGTLALGGYTLTVPATGTAALLGTANVFTAGMTLNSNTFDANSSAAYYPQFTFTNSANDNTAGYVIVQKSRASGNVVTSDTLGSFIFKGYASSAYRNSFGIDAIVESVSGSTVYSTMQFTALSTGLVGLYVTSTPNVGIGTNAFGTNAQYVISIKSGTAPTTSPADSVQIYSADYAAGDARLYVRTENLAGSPVALLGTVNDFTATQVISSSTSAEIKLRKNGVNAGDASFYNDGAFHIFGNSAFDQIYINSGNTTFWNITQTTQFVDISSKGIKVGGTSTRATTEGTNKLDIFDGTAPVGTLANGISLYSTAGELRVMDAAGNATLLSPHDEEGNWIYDSVSPVTGKHLRIDMEKFVKAVNQKLGLDFVKEYSI